MLVPEKLFYQHMAEVIVQRGVFGFTQEEYELVEMVSKGLLEQPELLYINYKLAPHAIETIKFLKNELGLKIAACSNSNTPLKRFQTFEQLGGFKVEEIFDAFIVSGDVGVRKPNVEILKILLSKFPEVKPHEAFMIGDQLDRDIICAHLASVRSIFYGVAPYNRQANAKALSHGHAPHFSILDFRQLPKIVKLLDEDAKFINSLNSQKFESEYRIPENYSQLPSSKRIRVGLLQDGDGANQIAKFWKTGLLNEDE